MKTSDQDVLWVLRAQSGDREAIELLLSAIQTPLRRYLIGPVGRDHTDDVLQDVLVLIYRKLVWLKDPALFRPWAFRIAGRAAFKCLKRQRRRLEDPAEDGLDAVPSPTRPTDELLSELHTLDISPASRAVLVLHFQEELSLPDVAALLEIPLGTVKSRLAYGLATLRRRLAGKESL